MIYFELKMRKNNKLFIFIVWTTIQIGGHKLDLFAQVKQLSLNILHKFFIFNKKKIAIT